MYYTYTSNTKFVPFPSDDADGYRTCLPKRKKSLDSISEIWSQSSSSSSTYLFFRLLLLTAVHLRPKSLSIYRWCTSTSLRSVSYLLNTGKRKNLFSRWHCRSNTQATGMLQKWPTSSVTQLRSKCRRNLPFFTTSKCRNCEGVWRICIYKALV